MKCYDGCQHQRVLSFHLDGNHNLVKYSSINGFRLKSQWHSATLSVLSTRGQQLAALWFSSRSLLLVFLSLSQTSLVTASQHLVHDCCHWSINTNQCWLMLPVSVGLFQMLKPKTSPGQYQLMPTIVCHQFLQVSATLWNSSIRVLMFLALFLK